MSINKMKKTDVLWKTQLDEVFAKIVKLLSTKLANTNTPGWFNKHMPAMGNILVWMTIVDKEELD